MTTMNISVTKPLEEFVKKQVNSGFYQSASEVFRAGLRLLKEKENEIDQKIAIGLKQIEEGKFVEVNDEYWENMKKRVTERINKHNKNKKNG